MTRLYANADLLSSTELARCVLCIFGREYLYYDDDQHDACIFTFSMLGSRDPPAFLIPIFSDFMSAKGSFDLNMILQPKMCFISLGSLILEPLGVVAASSRS
jgi:hypothetical protein